MNNLMFENKLAFRKASKIGVGKHVCELDEGIQCYINFKLTTFIHYLSD
jgi:hypothetical protein